MEALFFRDTNGFVPSLLAKPPTGRSKLPSTFNGVVLKRPHPTTGVELLDGFPSMASPITTATITSTVDIEKELSILPNLSELNRKLNRPSKKRVSLHSMLGTAAVGTSILAILPHLAFGLRDNITFLKLGVEDAVHLPQLHLANLALNLVMVTGMLRLPKKSYKARASIFQCIAAGMAGNFVMGVSNLMGPEAPFLLDAWTWPGRFLIGGTAIASSLGNANLYHDVITGSLKGREHNPFFETRRLGLISATKYCLGYVFQIAIMMPMFAPRAAFDAVTSPLMQACGATAGTLVFGKFVSNFYLAMGALCATFQFEQRASRRDCNLALASVAFFCLWDVYKYLFQFVRAAVTQEAGPKLAFVKCLGTIEKSFPVMTLWLLPIVLAIGHGAITAAREQRYHSNTTDRCHPRRMPTIAGLSKKPSAIGRAHKGAASN